MLRALYAVARGLAAVGSVASGDDRGRFHQGDYGCLSGFDVPVGDFRWGMGNFERQLNYGSTEYLERG
jgi:hypothetical protein